MGSVFFQEFFAQKIFLSLKKVQVEKYILVCSEFALHIYLNSIAMQVNLPI